MSSEHRQRPKSPTTSFVSTGVIEDLPVFSDPSCCEILLRVALHVQQTLRFEVLAYVVLPGAFRWIVHVGRGHVTVSDLMRDVKTQSAIEIMAYLDKEHSYGTLKVFARSARRLEDQRRRFWRPHFDETAIGDLETLRRRIDEIHDEPVLSKLAESADRYRFSSAGIHLQGERPLLGVTPLAELDWIV